MSFDSIIAWTRASSGAVACLLDARPRRHRFETIDMTPQRPRGLLVAQQNPLPRERNQCAMSSSLDVNEDA